jgi:cytochrome c
MAAGRRCRQVLAGLLLAASTPVLAAGSVDAGRRLYDNVCSFCHGALTPDVSPALAADNPSRIRRAINPLSTMGVLSFLTDQDLEDVATYIARPSTTDTDRLLDWAEQVLLPDFLGPPSGPSQDAAGYRYRYYPRAGMVLGTKDGNAYKLDAASVQPSLIGSVRQLLAALPKGR